jgi:hypothetical protein
MLSTFRFVELELSVRRAFNVSALFAQALDFSASKKEKARRASQAG